MLGVPPADDEPGAISFTPPLALDALRLNRVRARITKSKRNHGEATALERSSPWPCFSAWAACSVVS